MRSVKALLICTALCCIIAVSMIIGINIAWNNSPLSSAPEQSANSLVTNNLEVSVEQINLDGTLTAIEKDTLLFGEDTVWTPGHAEIVYLVVTNKEETVVNYSIGVNFADSAAAKNAAGEEVKLSDVLHFGIVDSLNDFYGEPADAIADLGVSKALSSGFSRVGAIDAEGIEILAVLVYLPESAGELTGGEIDLGLSLYVTSPLVKEEQETTPSMPNQFTGSVDIPEVNEDGSTTESVTIGANSQISAVLPEGVKLAEGATELSLTVSKVEESQANVTLGENETKVSLDVHIEGIATDNDVPMKIKLARAVSKGLNSGSIKLYHVENGETIEMTQVALADEFTAHNQFKYDPATGDLILYMASFSEVAVIADTSNPWDGTVATGFNGGTGTEADPYIIANAEQLAYFRNQVDGGINYSGQFVKLTANIDLNNVNFDPIGFSYLYKGGQVFKGTFDGNGYTISNLYQNGWDLDADKYCYSMAGGGFFASVEDATIKNVTFKNAEIVMECIEQGVVAGLAAGNCTFENINILGCSVANYQRATGGVVGEVNPYRNSDGSIVKEVVTHTFKNIIIDSQTVIGSLWGDFDAPVGGVIGAKWDDDVNVDGKGVTQVVMENVTVACRLDVYNDVTSTYQWYSYRRAGMLIGNTEEVAEDGRTALADFLTCENVVVKYGDWRNYHYCEFNNHNSSWPFVRVEAGENCEAFSNPRWGVPNDINGVKVTPKHHPAQDTTIHKEGDDCYVLLTFNQLYGGGQGVYGQVAHTNVDVQDCYYTITYREGDTIHHTEKVYNNSQEITSDKFYKMPSLADDQYQWVNSGSTAVESIAANNINDVTLYLDRADTYIARFLNQDGTLYKAIAFNNQTGKLNESEPAVPAVDGLDVVGWESYTLKGAKGDISVKPVYKINDYVQLNPVDTDGDGVPNYYEVVGSNIPANNTDIIIPAEVNGVEVHYIVTGAFQNGGLRDVYVPNTIKYIGKNAFCKDDNGGFLDNGEFPQIQIIFDGTRDEWDNLTKEGGWDDNIGTGSVIICTKEPTPGYYLQNGSNGFWGSNISIKWEWQSGSYPDWYPRTTN